MELINCHPSPLAHSSGDTCKKPLAFVIIELYNELTNPELPGPSPSINLIIGTKISFPNVAPMKSLRKLPIAANISAIILPIISTP